MNQSSMLAVAVLALLAALMVGMGALAREDQGIDEEYYIRYQGIRFVGHTAPILGVSVSPDGSRLVSFSKDGTARLWDARTGVCLWARLGRFDDVSFAPDGRHLLFRQGRRTWQER